MLGEIGCFQDRPVDYQSNLNTLTQPTTVNTNIMAFLQQRTGHVLNQLTLEVNQGY